MNTVSALRNCPVCGESPELGILYAERSLDPSRLTDFSYASRKTPEFMCYRLVKCGNCNVIFASDPPESRQLFQAYDTSSFDSAVEAECAADSYMQALAPHLSRLSDRRALLEIGAGTGVFLEKMQVIGFETSIGIEPSQSAINAASNSIRPHLRHNIFHGEEFADKSFSLICCFMTMEHVSAPLNIAKQCHRLLAPGGLLALVTHDYTAMINRTLGRRSPIIDIEHLQLFHPQSLKVMLSSCGFSDIQTQQFRNTYKLNYWLRLLPTPKWLNASVINPLLKTKFGNIKLTVNVGNIMTVSQRIR